MVPGRHTTPPGGQRLAVASQAPLARSTPQRAPDQ
jgi:hypothetical protein